MQLKHPETIIRNLYEKYVKKVDNVIYVDKLFVVNTVINYLFKGKTYKELDQFQIARYGELINKYLKGEVDIFWQDGTIMVRDMENGDITGG